jgi:hypothetical protein
MNRDVPRGETVMAATFPPGREADLLNAALLFDTKITATPTAYGLVAAQATAFHALRQAFADAYAVAHDPLTRSPANIVAKDLAKKALLVNFRQLVGIVQKFPGTTNFTRSELGIPQRASEPSPIPPPATAPTLIVRSVTGRTVRIRLRAAASPDRRGKPDGAQGASLFSHVGATPPAALSDWTFEGNTSRTAAIDIEFPTDVPPGAVVWLTACWFNPRKQAGPACDPVQANLPGGGVSEAA